MVFHEFYNTNGIYFDYKLSSVIHGLAKALFSIGAFSAAVKYASTLKFFKDQYKDIVMSDEFENLIGRKLDAFAHSTDYLDKLDLNQLKDLWRDVTLSKYKNSFPAIYDDLKLNLENELFLKANTSFYYKHFYVEFDIKLDEKDHNFVNVIYKTKYTIVRNTVNKFKWSFWKTSIKESQEDATLETLIDIDGDEVFNSKKAEYKNDKNIDNNGILTLECSEILEGKKQYHVKKVTTYKQDLMVDRALGFGSGRIIDDLFVTIKYSKDLDVFFSKSNDNNFKEDLDKENGVLKYENRNLLLPGEKFKLFLIRPGK